MTPLLLGSLFELKYGKSLRKDTRSQGVVPVFGSNGQVDVHSESLVNHPTIIVGRKGSIGEVHLVKTPCWPIDTTYFVSPRGEHEVDLDWLYRLLRTLRLQELNRSAAIPGLNRDDVYRIPILLPPLDAQIRIAHLLGKVEGLIAQRKQHLQQLDDLLKSVFLEMFGDPVRNEKGWETGTSSIYADLVTVGVVVKPASHYVEHGVIALRSLNIKPNRIDLSDLVYFSQESSDGILSKSRLQTNDVVIVRTGKTGTAAVVPAALDGANCIDLIVVRPKPAKIHPQFLTCLLNSERGMALVSSLEVGGIQKHFNVGALNKIHFPLPPPPLQGQFADVVNKVEAIKSRYQQSLTDLEALYGALSQQAFKGELDLSRVPSPIEDIQPIDSECVHPQHTDQLLSAVPLTTPSEVVNRLVQAGSEYQRVELLARWFQQYLTDTSPDASLGSAQFIESAWQALQNTEFEGEGETPALTLDDYDALKAIAFDALRSGELIQSFDEDSLRVALRRVTQPRASHT